MDFDGPIPGENFTSNTKNYPWHRPPEYTDLDEAIEAAFAQITDEDNYIGLLTMLSSGVSVASAASMFVISGIGAGKWTPDFAMILAGPVAHIIYLMAEGYGMKVNMGLDKKKPTVTAAFMKNMKVIDQRKAEEAVTDIDIEEVKSSASGFMDMKKDVE